MCNWSSLLVQHVIIPALKAKQIAEATLQVKQLQADKATGSGAKNTANQGISQSQSNAQNAQCVSGAPYRCSM